MQEQFAIILANEPGVIEGGVEPLHDMRVAIRRLRTLLRALAPACGGISAERMEERFDRLQKALGPARDADVLIGILESKAVCRILEGLHAREEVLEKQRALLEQRKETVRTLVSGALYRRLKNDAARFIEAGCPAQGFDRPKLRKQALAALRKAMDRVRRRSVMPASCPPDAIHALRIACRRARYLCEFFGPDLGTSVSALGQRLKTIQDVLGDVHDLDVLVSELENEHVAVPAALLRAFREKRKRLLRAFRREWARQGDWTADAWA